MAMSIMMWVLFILKKFTAKVTQLSIFLFNLFNYLNSPYFTGKYKQLFLKRIYNEWRLLFWLVIVFILAQVFFMAKAIENVPFFLYHMYSKAHPKKDSTAVYLVKTPDGYFNHKRLSSREQEILMNSVAYYVNLKNDGDGIIETIQKRFSTVVGSAGIQTLKDRLSNDSSSLAGFPQWWGNYFQSIAANNYDSVSVVRSYVYSKAPYGKSGNDSLIFKVKLR